jgi:hypothetical protein
MQKDVQQVRRWPVFYGAGLLHGLGNQQVTDRAGNHHYSNQEVGFQMKTSVHLRGRNAPKLSFIHGTRPSLTESGAAADAAQTNAGVQVQTAGEDAAAFQFGNNFLLSVLIFVVPTAGSRRIV